MFYSHTFLARKGPLGTVWIAAHLQHKLRKSHYVQTNVATTVEKIMNPEVPIALRMSGHLLLGVVRIYSKQVDYFFEECNEISITINRVFTTVTVNLPNDATQAPFHSITLPERFNLDAMELDDYNMDRGNDSHLRSLDEITLTEQIPTGNDPYIVVSFDEQDLRETSGSGSTRMVEDGHHHLEMDASAAGFKSPSRSINLEADGNRTPPSIEVMRDGRHDFDFNNSPILPDRADPDKVLEDQINRDKEMHTPVREEVVFHNAHFSSSHKHQEHPSFGHLDSHVPFVRRHSPDLELQPTPQLNIQPTPELQIQPTPVEKPKVTRKRKQHYDMETVLSNEFVRNMLDDTSDILRARRESPHTPLSIWKQINRKRLRKEGLFVESYATGCSADLQGLYREDSAKNHLDPIQETNDETNVDMETEVLRNNAGASPERFMPHFSTPVTSPSGRNRFTPENTNLHLESEHEERTGGDRTFFTSEAGTSGNHDSEIRTPDAFDGSDMHFDRTVLSDIPELVPSGGDLAFLEQDYDSPTGSQGTSESGTLPRSQSTADIHGLSSRTRAVAQNLKRQLVTPISGNSEEPSVDLSLTEILADKTRKVCARMFYETLVLKHNGFVNVRQEKPYDDIVLKATPKLWKEDF